MSTKDIWREFKCFGSATVGLRGQVVIPASIRKELGLDAGARLLVFMGPGKRGLFLFKADAVEQIVSMLAERLSDIEKVLKDYTSVATAGGSKGKGK